MKKSNLVIMMIMVLSLACLSKQSLAETNKTAPVKKNTINQSLSKSFAGTVESISTADPAKSQLVVVNKAGKKHTFTITSTTKVFDTSGGSTAIGQVKEKSKVRVKYSTKNGVEEALAIHLLP